MTGSVVGVSETAVSASPGFRLTTGNPEAIEEAIAAEIGPSRRTTRWRRLASSSAEPFSARISSADSRNSTAASSTSAS